MFAYLTMFPYIVMNKPSIAVLNILLAKEDKYKRFFKERQNDETYMEYLKL